MGIITSAISKRSDSKNELSQYREYLEEIITDTRDKLANAYESFNYLTDNTLIEACIFEINSLQLRYNYYMHQLKLCRPENQT